MLSFISAGAALVSEAAEKARSEEQKGAPAKDLAPHIEAKRCAQVPPTAGSKPSGGWLWAFDISKFWDLQPRVGFAIS